MKNIRYMQMTNLLWSLSMINYKLKWFFSLPRRILDWGIRVCQYAPFLWNDRDWDHSGFLRFMDFKLKRMRICFKKNDLVLAAPRMCKQIAYAEFLIKRIQDDDYYPELQTAIEMEFGTMQINFEPHDIGANKTNRMLITSSKCVTKEMNEAAAKKRSELYRKQYEAQLKDYDRLFRHVRKYIQGWWD